MGLALAQAIEDIRVLGHFDGQGIVVFLDLVFRRMGRTVIGDSCGFDDQVAVVIIGIDGSFHVTRTADINAAGQAYRCLEVIRRPGDEGDFSTGHDGSLGDGKAHAAAGMIADEADRVDRFPRAASRDDDLFPFQEVIAAGQELDVVDDGIRFGQAADAVDAAGQMTAVGSDEMIAEFLQLGHIVLSNGVEIHVGIHSRCDEDRCRRSHDRRRQHVVGNAVGDLANDVGRRRCDDEDVGPAGQGDVFYVEFRHIVEHGYGNGIAGNFPHRQGRNQFRRMVGHDAFDFGPPLAELTGNRSCLEGRNAASDS